ncbi:GGDEF domain-containing protein [Butyrivibrio sp. AE2032]|uniref:GGDEF domain-containing protein n=1 Tax=Butyrivibrio sp. AE2032 TaxID=1458463 RepID=UPI0005552265|nr:GGDEF domain-containing protein [Butyrivibrio sp. AE2032]
MNIFNFFEMELSEKDHVILSADEGLYDALMSGVNGSFDDYIDEAYKDLYLKGLSLADNKWFAAGIKTNNGVQLYCLKVSFKEKTNTLHVVLAGINELIDNNNYLTDTVTAFKSQLELYDDVYFDYDPEAQNVILANTQAAEFDAGLYSIDDIENMLCKKVSQSKQDRIKAFIGQVKAKAGRATTHIEANLINDDPSVQTTILEAKYVNYSSQKEHVVGHMHLEHRTGGPQVSSLKRDSLTGLLEKADIMRIAQERINERRLEGTTLGIIDIDFFKNVNDSFGHQFGDTVIKQIADIISFEVGAKGVTGRFGGDEFLIVFYNITEEQQLRVIFRAIRDKVRAAFIDRELPDNNPISVSIGSASFSRDADNYEDVFLLADQCLYIAKEKGRNRYIIYDSEKHGSLEDIKQQEMTKKLFNDRGDLSYGDIIVKMYEVALHGKGTTPEALLDEFAQTFKLQRMCLIVGTPFKLRYATGLNGNTGFRSPDVLLGVLNSDTKEKYLAGRDFVVVNKLDTLPPQAGSIKAFLKEIGVLSYILMRFYDKDNNECFIIVSSLGKAVQWNESHFMYYRALSDLISRFSLKEP